ncbi:DUF5700 domain-containing putative Zn-dependent protease [Clostridium sp. C8-1-8]|uniref:DUF5700 domain-containing putative Zn-dependent protease n=1 Tax=Clostridium sp. C8-1-8 TaxID=2698831 RepID=UPI0013693EBC|nr:DUF5700 domain-containing putative Zn-dependent protease [Clostridium sp. C8-1-8]
MSISFDYSALNRSIELFDNIEKNTLTENQINRYLEEEGIKFLNEHLFHYGGSMIGKELLVKLFSLAIENPKLEGVDNIILKSIKQGFSRLSCVKKTLSKLDLNQIIDNSVKMANKFLPIYIDDDLDIKVYFLYGIRGTSIVLKDKIAVDLCDEVLWEGDKINSEFLTRIIAHEVHHIGTDRNFKAVIDGLNSAREKGKVRLLSELLSEGSAMYYLNNPEELSSFKSTQWQNNDENMALILEEVELIIDKIIAGGLEVDKEIEVLFGQELKGYWAGYHMVEIIDRIFGLNTVLECISNINLFLEYYNTAKKSTNT